MTIFYLPDLGEGLPEAEIVEWLIQEGDTLITDQPMVLVETAKAVVSIPAPHSGVVLKRYAQTGEFVKTGAPLIDITTENSIQATTIRSETTPTPTPISTPTPTPISISAPLEEANTGSQKTDKGTVVGQIPENVENLESLFAAQQAPLESDHLVRAIPAARHLAQQKGIALTQITGTGPNGIIVLSDVEKTLKTQPPVTDPLISTPSQGTMAHPAGKSNTEVLRGARRTMAHAMTRSHAEVVAVTLEEDAHIHRWRSHEDTTLRLIRAIAHASLIEPSLNAWYNHDRLERTGFEDVHLGIAVDTKDGLYVPVIPAVNTKKPHAIRLELDELRHQIQERTVPPERFQGATITLSNFGTIAGRYATPIVTPPQVAIVGAGRCRNAVVAHKGKVKIRRVLPLSLSFDHRSITGGEAARFLRALIEDLENKI